MLTREIRWRPAPPEPAEPCGQDKLAVARQGEEARAGWRATGSQLITEPMAHPSDWSRLGLEAGASRTPALGGALASGGSCCSREGGNVQL